MRTLFLPLAVVSVLALVGPSCADFDSGGVGPVNSKATQVAGTTFDSSVAASKRIRAADDFQLFLTGAQPLVFAVPPPGFVVVGGLKAPAPQPTNKRGANLPRPKR